MSVMSVRIMPGTTRGKGDEAISDQLLMRHHLGDGLPARRGLEGTYEADHERTQGLLNRTCVRRQCPGTVTRKGWAQSNFYA